MSLNGSLNPDNVLIVAVLECNVNMARTMAPLCSQGIILSCLSIANYNKYYEVVDVLRKHLCSRTCT